MPLEQPASTTTRRTSRPPAPTAFCVALLVGLVFFWCNDWLIYETLERGLSHPAWTRYKTAMMARTARACFEVREFWNARHGVALLVQGPRRITRGEIPEANSFMRPVPIVALKTSESDLQVVLVPWGSVYGSVWALELHDSDGCAAYVERHVRQLGVSDQDWSRLWQAPPSTTLKVRRPSSALSSVARLTSDIRDFVVVPH